MNNALEKRIEKLEEHIKVWEEAFFCMDRTNEILRLLERIEKLEQFKIWCDQELTLMDEYYKKEISELKEQIKKFSGETEDSARHIRPCFDECEVKPIGNQSDGSKPECLICHNTGCLDDGGSIVGCYHCGRDYRINSKPEKPKVWKGEKPLTYANEKKGDF